jgi:hypothetical protein
MNPTGVDCSVCSRRNCSCANVGRAIQSEYRTPEEIAKLLNLPKGEVSLSLLKLLAANSLDFRVRGKDCVWRLRGAG